MKGWRVGWADDGVKIKENKVHSADSSPAKFAWQRIPLVLESYVSYLWSRMHERRGDGLLDDRYGVGGRRFMTGSIKELSFTPEHLEAMLHR